MSNLEDIAIREFKEEQEREKIDKIKDTLRTKKSIWARIFPYTVTITVTKRS